MATTDYSLDRGLPSNVEAERSLLGAILLDNTLYTDAGAALKPDDFFLDAHRRIYARMLEMADTNRPIDIVTLSEELSRHKELEAVGGVAYLSSLTDGTPRRTSIEHYVRIVRDKSLMRGVIRAANTIMQSALDQSDTAADVLDRAEAEIFSLSENRNQQDLVSVAQVAMDSFGGNLDKLYERGKRITGLETHYTDLDDLTSGLQRKELIIIAARPSMGKTAFAINIAENCAVRDNKMVAVFSLEMGREALLHRMLCSQSRVDSQNLRKGFLGKEDMGKLRDGLDVAHAGAHLHRRHAGHLDYRTARQVAAAEAKRRTARSDCRRLPSAHVGFGARRTPLREPHSGSFGHFARPQGHRQGTRRAAGGALAVEPRSGNPQRQGQ